MRAPARLTAPRLAILLLALFGLLLLAAGLLFYLATLAGPPFEWLALVVLLVVLVGSLASVLAKQRRARQLVEQNQQALALINRGDLQGAARLLDDLIAQAATFRALCALFVLNRSVVWTLQGHPEKALELARPILEDDWHKHGLQNHAGAVVGAVATPLILLSRVEEAEALLRASVPSLTPVQLTFVLAARALVAARSERWEEALALISTEAAAAEGVLPARSLRLLSTLATFAAERAGKPAPTLQWPPASATDLGYLADRWPAFAAWLETRPSDAARRSS